MPVASEWTINTLHALVVTLQQESERRYEQRFDAQDRAVAKAEAATEKRFEGVNEFRAALSDQAATLMPRAEASTRFDAISDKINKAELELRDTIRRDDLKPINEAINRLRDVDSTGAGKSQTISSFVTTGIAIVAVIVSLAGAFIRQQPAEQPFSQQQLITRQELAGKLDEVARQLQLNRDVQRQIIPGGAK